MFGRLHTSFAARPVIAVVLSVALVGAGAAAWLGAVQVARLRAFSASASRFTTGDPSTPAAYRALGFRYRGRTRFVRAPIDTDELSAARELRATDAFSTVGPVREAYIRRLVDSQSRSRTVTAVARELRRIRAELDLDSDAYLELIARFVQEIPYGTIDDEVRLPVEVVAEGAGVCDDKSILLASLMVAEGYDTVVWAFDSQAHAAVGVRCLGPGMRGSGYAFIETTQPAYIGQVGGTLGGYARWRRSPQLVRVGGHRRYAADLEAEFVASALRRAQGSARALEPYRRRAVTGPAAWRDEYREAAERQGAAHRMSLLLARTDADRGALFTMLTTSGHR